MKTGAELLTELQGDLDIASESGEWSVAVLLGFLNRAANKVASIVRQSGEGYLDATITYTTSDFTVYGATYSPATSLALAAGATTITLPENLVSVKNLQTTSTTQLTNGLTFNIVKSDNPDYKISQRWPTGQYRQYYYCVFEGLTQLRVAPSLYEAVNLSLSYSAMPERVTFDGEVEGVPEYGYNAILVYAQYLALWSIKHEDVSIAYQMWQTERKELLEMISQRDETETMIVAGVFEDEYEDEYSYL